jgi:hypothetical protein
MNIGEVVDTSTWRNADLLVRQRYLRPWTPPVSENAPVEAGEEPRGELDPEAGGASPASAKRKKGR